MTKEQFKILEKYMLDNVSEHAHDSLHIYRVLNNALIIAKKEKNVNYDILVTSCLLHDIARKKEILDPNICHAIEGGKMAYQFLIKEGYGHTFSEEVQKCITTHRFRSNNPPISIEAKILFDADKLDVVGAIGIARTLIYNGALNEPLYYLDSELKIDLRSNFEAKNSFLKEYNYKLVKLYDKFLTKEGKRLSKHLKKVSKKFYNELINQITIDNVNEYLKKLN